MARDSFEIKWFVPFLSHCIRGVRGVQNIALCFVIITLQYGVTLIRLLNIILLSCNSNSILRGLSSESSSSLSFSSSEFESNSNSQDDFLTRLGSLVHKFQTMEQRAL